MWCYFNPVGKLVLAMQVQKVGDISHKEFIKDFYKPGIPVIFKTASKAWKANGLFTPDYFRKNFGERRTVVNDQEYSVREILDLVENSSADFPAPYPCKFDIPSQLPELLSLISPLGMHYAEPNWFESKAFPGKIYGSAIELFFGGPGGKFPVAHIDLFHTNAWITQLYGKKNFVVYPRGQDEFLYPKSGNQFVSEVNIFNPDYQKHPKYRNATPITVTVEQGETIFIPWGIWHSSESLTPSISVIFDQINSSNFADWTRDVWQHKKQYNKVKAVVSMAYYAVAANLLCRIGDALGVKRKIL
jgi:histone arginine demethylase JMJD6